MNKILLLTSVTITFILCLGHASVIMAEESDYSNTAYNEDEAKEQRSFLRPFLEPSYIPSPEYLASCKGAKGSYKGDETPDQLKALSAKYQDNYNRIKEALPEKLSVRVVSKRRVLVLTYRTGGIFHGAGAAGMLILLREAAKKYDAFELTEVYKPDGIDATMLAGFDAVVLNNITFKLRSGEYGVSFDKEHMGLHPERLGDETKVFKLLTDELLPAYVKNGGGILGTHAAALLHMGDDDKPVEYTTMLGGVVDGWCHPKSSKGYYKGEFVVKLLEPENPLVAAFREAPQPIRLTTELYSFWLPKSSINDTRPLAGFDYEKKPEVSFNDKSVERSKDFASALIWIKSYGKGRVYYNVMGHDEEIHTVPCVARAYLDGLLYATGDLKVPDKPDTIPTTRKETP